MYNVDGFIFNDEAMAQIAKKEGEGVRYIKEHTALNDAETVFQLYTKLVSQELFTTPVGLRFLTELQNVLYASPEIDKREILPIRIAADAPEKSDQVQQVKEVTKKINQKEEGKYKKPFYVALFFAIVFGLSVVGMFVITEISGNSVTILNYRNEIQNEYASWEEELKEKEAELKAWEKELEEKEAE